MKYNIDVLPKSWAINQPDLNPDEVVSFIMENSDQHTDVALGAFVWAEKSLKHVLSELDRYKFKGR